MGTYCSCTTLVRVAGEGGVKMCKKENKKEKTRGGEGGGRGDLVE